MSVLSQGKCEHLEMFSFSFSGGQTPKPDSRFHAHVSASLYLGNERKYLGSRAFKYCFDFF